MKKYFAFAFAALLAASATNAQQQTQTAPGAAPQAESVLKTEKDRISYSLGMNIGSSLKMNEVDVNTDLVIRGLKDAISNTKPLLTDDEIRAALTAFQTSMQAKQAASKEKELTENKTKGDAFLAANKAKEGVVVLPSGLQYKVLKTGTGPKPVATDTVSTHYKGTLIDGTVFDSSIERNEPATFQVGGVIKGWTEALQLMNVGSKWQLVIPADLAYGERGAGGVIGPNETLIFEVELLSIQGGTPKQ